MNEVRYEIKLVLNESQLNDLLILIKQQRSRVNINNNKKSLNNYIS